MCYDRFFCLFFLVFVFFFFKQKTAYEMRISDWSSDVCSSDLDLVQALRALVGEQRRDPAAHGVAGEVDLLEAEGVHELTDVVDHVGEGELQIGRASCRERVCQYV